MFYYKMISVIAEFLKMLWSWIRPENAWFSDASLVGKIAIVTGGSNGIGKETTRGLAIKGAKVIIACNDTRNGEKTKAEISIEIEKEYLFKPCIIVRHLNLASLASIRKFATEVLEEEKYIHILVNNAAVLACPSQWKTEDGFEMQFGVNYLGHFYLTSLLLDRLKASAPARIINLSSVCHYFGEIHFEDINLEKNYGHFRAYNQSKLAIILFTRELAKRLKGSGVTAYALHPGIVYSGIAEKYLLVNINNLIKLFFDFGRSILFKNLKQGARTTLYCATEELLSNESGFYYSGCRKALPSPAARDDKAAKCLWNLSKKLTNLQ